MKKTILIAALIVSAIVSSAQTHLPDTVTVRLSQRDLFAITQRIDSLQNVLYQTSDMPAKQVTAIIIRLNMALSVMYNQIQRQMVADKGKVAPGVPKKN